MPSNRRVNSTATDCAQLQPAVNVQAGYSTSQRRFEAFTEEEVAAFLGVATSVSRPIERQLSGQLFRSGIRHLRRR